MIFWSSKYYIKTNVISTLKNLVQARIKKLSKFYISTQFKLVEIKVWTYKYILLGIVCYVYKDSLSKYQSYDPVFPIMHWGMNN